MYHRYGSREAAGKVLADLVAQRRLRAQAVVVGLPRGGVPVAAEIATRLGAPMDVMLVRKIGAPGHAELACGALILGGEVVWNTQVMRALKVTREDLESTYQDELEEAKRRESALRSRETPRIPLRGCSVILVDDGVATGATMKAAVQSVFMDHPEEVIVCIPCGPVSACREIEAMGCDLICDQRIDDAHFDCVGEWYDSFPQVSTDECRALLISNRSARSVLSSVG